MKHTSAQDTFRCDDSLEAEDPSSGLSRSGISLSDTLQYDLPGVEAPGSSRPDPRQPDLSQADTQDTAPNAVGSVVSAAFFRDAVLIEPMSMQTFLVQHGEREYMLRREGECAAGDCGSPCCAMICLGGEYTEYLEGFADKGVGSAVMRKRCSFLGADDRCTRWRQENYPLACLMFPIPGDHLFLEVMDVCSYRFIIEADITNMRERGAGFYEGRNGD